ncbi:UDP-glucuronate 4-epimerase [Catalinimonas alkaloidigena]|uniref:NAD-dependent epimerase n=1 Tax=Catalinimonas alkaloidigena TaxID=1075417 RepID=UPI0024070A80|nr:NAD-dependent epimerase [Catalinimonas alkaloidigena]MDF9801109.1 UDP-glucuronate 4-epimerase [Catalinimonas alkaloidigena]
MSQTKKVLVTGAAGFIGFHLSQKLCQQGFEVVGIDNLNDYYDPNLKKSRLDILKVLSTFSFHKIDLLEKERIDQLFETEKFHYVVNLAAQAGVRYSLVNPYAYIDANVTGFLNILEACRHYPVEHLVYASSSSVYGANSKMPFSVHHNVDHPVSLYAATKKSNELMAHTYSNLYNIPTTGLRFFTVYGPYGRPDMALFLFTKAILENRPIDVYNNGEMKRDFTYVDDIVEGVIKLLPHVASPSPSWDGNNPDAASSFAPYALYNIGNNNPVKLLDFISTLEQALGMEAQKNMMPIQDGDVPATFADVDDLIKDVGFKPATPLIEGIQKFVDWYREYYTK